MEQQYPVTRVLAILSVVQRSHFVCIWDRFCWREYAASPCYADAQTRIRVWSDDDYDVFDAERLVGRILHVPQAPEGQPWFWTITARAPQYPHDRGYAASREQAMAAFKAAWEREP